MDRSPRELNGHAAPNAAAPQFALRDPVTGKIRPIKDMTDEELERWLHNLGQEAREVQQKVLQMQLQTMDQLTQLRAIREIISYEKYRRAASLVVVPP